MSSFYHSRKPCQNNVNFTTRWQSHPSFFWSCWTPPGCCCYKRYRSRRRSWNAKYLYEMITTVRPAYSVICGGLCRGLNADKPGNIVVSDKLTTYSPATVDSRWDGVRPECGVTLVAVFRSAKLGWKAPAGHSDVHEGEIVSGPSLGWGHGHKDELSKRFGGALAAESVGGGNIKLVSTLLVSLAPNHHHLLSFSIPFSTPLLSFAPLY